MTKKIEPTSVVSHLHYEVDGEDEPYRVYEIGTGIETSTKEVNSPYNARRIQGIRLVTDSSKETTEAGLNIILEIDTSQVFDEADQDKTNEFIEQAPERNSGEVITMKLRELDYCDADGNQQKILVFASEPYDVE